MPSMQRGDARLCASRGLLDIGWGGVVGRLRFRILFLQGTSIERRDALEGFPKPLRDIFHHQHLRWNGCPGVRIESCRVPEPLLGVIFAAYRLDDDMCEL